MCVCCYNPSHASAVKGFWALRDNIYECSYVVTVAMVTLVRDFVLYGILFMDMCIVITVAIVMLCYKEVYGKNSNPRLVLGASSYTRRDELPNTKSVPLLSTNVQRQYPTSILRHCSGITYRK
jgi:hypothetical protein